MNSSWVHCQTRHAEISVADQISRAASDAIFGTFLIALTDISHAAIGAISVQLRRVAPAKRQNWNRQISNYTERDKC
jgi:hypothetical protein